MDGYYVPRFANLWGYMSQTSEAIHNQISRFWKFMLKLSKGNLAWVIQSKIRIVLLKCLPLEEDLKKFSDLESSSTISSSMFRAKYFIFEALIPT